MSHSNDSKPETPAPKRPYEAPKVIAEESFETRALSCTSAPRVCRGRGNGGRS
jgi:hypothetical protein